MPIERDPQSGKITGGKLTAEEQQRLADARRAKKGGKVSAEAILRDFGFEDVDDAPSFVRVIAQQAAGGKVAALSGLRWLVSEARKGSLHAPGQIEHHTPTSDNPCPTCGCKGDAGHISIYLSKPVADQTLATLERARRDRELPAQTRTTIQTWRGD